jgi:4-amino-4-deoxy-L-arabinose transferase-like glycosyltransferase
MAHKTNWLLLIVWLSFVLRGIFYCSAFPIYEGFDEYAHFAVIQHIFFHHDIPNPQLADSSRQIAESLKLVPVAWIIRDDAEGLLSYESYWRLSAADRLERQGRLRTLPPAWSSVDAVPRLPLYEAQQPPLYYWILLPLYSTVQSLDLPTQVWALRCASLLLASTVIPIAFVTAKKVFADHRAALGVAVVIASMPQFAMDAFRISNNSLSISLGGLAVYVVITLWNSPPNLIRGMLAGLVIGAALLAKAYFLVLLPWAAFVLISVLVRDRQQRKAPAWQLVACLTTSLAISGWYYWRLLTLTGTLTGEQNDIGAQTSQLSLTHAIGIMPWRSIFDFIAVSHIWLGNWSFLGVRTWMYRVIELVFVLAFFGLVLHFVRPRTSLPKRSPLGMLMMPCVFLFVGICFHAVQSFRSAGNIGTFGYYMFALIVPEAILLLVGLFRLLPDDWRLLAVPVIALFFALLEQFGTTFVLLPYYAGLIQHDSQGRLSTLKISQLAHGGSRRLFENLLANKASFLTAPDLMIMMALSFGACVALISVACAIATRRSRAASW